MPDARRPGSHVIAVDFGSSSVRAAVAAPDGKLLATTRRPVALRKVAGLPELGREIDAERTWRNIARCVRSARRASGVRPSQIAAIGVASQRQGVVVLDGALDTVYAGPNNDMRAVFQGGMIDEVIGDLVWRATGRLPSFMFAWSKLLWLREERPRMFQRARHALPLADWVVFRLSGDLAMERALGVEAGLARVADGDPATEIGESLGLASVRLPLAVDAGAIVGELQPAAAQPTGLPVGIPVVACGPDTQAALIGLGVVAPRAAGVVAGWSCPVQKVTASPVFDEKRRLWTGRHVIHNRWIVEGNAGVMGGAHEWLGRLLQPDATPAAGMDALARKAARVDPGAGGASAFLGPAREDMSAPGLRPGGIMFPVPLVVDAPGAGRIARAALESYAFAIRANIEALESVTGSECSQVVVGGGMTRTRGFAALLAHVLGRPIRAGDPEATLAGTAMLAASAAPGGPSLEEAIAARRRTLRRLRPRADLAAVYAELFETWRRNASLLADLTL